MHSESITGVFLHPAAENDKIHYQRGVTVSVRLLFSCSTIILIIVDLKIMTRKSYCNTGSGHDQN